MTIPALEVADVLRAYGPAYMGEFGDQLSSEQRRVLRIWSAAVQRNWAGMWRSVIAVATGASPTTPAATATAPSVRRRRAPAGWRSAPPSYSPWNTSTSS